jgi:Rps23 Pro-64 3,4-dihydroxylase Tpa1-like proline 4-hydroxylase
MFNRENIAQAQADFAEKRYCVIDNVLEPQYIKALYEAVPKLEYGVWTCTHNAHKKYRHGFQDSIEFQPALDDHIERSRGQFSYWHYAYWLLEDYHKVHNNPRVTEFNRVVTEDYSILEPDYTFHDLVSEVTGFTNMYTDQPTYSYYDHTAWLNAHHDPRRWCAYIFYFNDTWLTQWGGQLCILDKDEITIKDSIEPFGNRLAIMDVSELSGERINKHFISPVSITADHPRYSLAGWFYQKETDGASPIKG